MAVEIFIAVLALLIVLLYYKLFTNSKKGIWKNQGVTEVPNSIFNEIYMQTKKPLNEILDDLYKKHGRVFGTFQFGAPILMVSDPELLKQIFVKDFNVFPNRLDRTNFKSSDEIFENMLSVLDVEAWKKVRTIVSPTFSTGKIKKMSHLIEKCADSLVKNFEANQNKTLDMKDYFGAFTMDVIARCAFGITLDSHNDPNNPFVKHASTVFKPRLSMKLLLILIMPNIIKKRMNVEIFPKDATDFFMSVTRKIIASRKIEKDKIHEDFLQLLIEAEEKDSNEIKKNLSEIEIIGQAFIFFVAGYDTTSNVLSFAAYNLATNPEVQKMLQKEIDNAADNLGDKNLYEIISSLPYLEAFVSETLRLQAPVIRLDRIASRDYKLNNIHIPKGTAIGVPTSSIHNDKEFFPEPEKFKPERFFHENKDQIDPYTYMPFGAGPRNCVAVRFALLEVKYALFKVVREFEFIATDEAKAGLEINRFSLLYQAKTFPLQVVRRKRN